MDRSDIISYILICFIVYICIQIYMDSDYFNLKCIVSKEDGNKYCVRDRENLTSRQPQPLQRVCFVFWPI